MSETAETALKVQDLEPDPDTPQHLTPEEAEEAQGGIGLPLYAPQRPPQQPPAKQQ